MVRSTRNTHREAARLTLATLLCLLTSLVVVRAGAAGSPRGLPACGNGIVEAGEQCDATGAGDGCCSIACTFEAAGTSCDDEPNACTEDMCDGAGSCTHEAVVCPAVECGDMCAPETGSCTRAAGTPCSDDGNECTTDACDGAGGCTHDASADGTGCDDGDPATPLDECVGGECVGRPCGGIAGIECNPGRYCELPAEHCCCDFQGECYEPPTICPANVEPVCGCNDVTYGNDCVRRAAGVSKAHDGECGRQTMICEITSRLVDEVVAGSLQWDTDYSTTAGVFAGYFDNVSCEALVGELAAFRDDDLGRELSTALVDRQGMTGPTELSRCQFLGSHVPRVDQLMITVTEARGTDLATIEGVAVEVSDIDCAKCGQPLSRGEEPVASDCLPVLKTAVRSDSCPPCLCDVTEPLGIFASDALACLKRAVGEAIVLDCPACNRTEQELCETTGGRWDSSSCGHYGCGLPPLCQAVIPGCDCGFFKDFDPVAGCAANTACGVPGS